MSWFDNGFTLDSFSDCTEDTFMDSLSARGKKLAIKYFQTGGLISEVQLAIDLVTERPGLITDNVRREQFCNMSAKKAAKSLCTTIVRYIYLTLTDFTLPPFREYYIDLVNKGAYQYRGKVFTYLNSSVFLVKDYVDMSTYKEMKNVKINSDKVNDLIQLSNVEVVMFRNWRNSHTFLGVVENHKIVRIDTYHKSKLGQRVLGKVKYLYYYLDGLNV